MRQWILLRGLTRETAHWGGLVADLQQALPGDAVLAVDLPGNGCWHHRPSPTTVQGMVQACRADLAARGLAPPYHLLAMSLGAMVAVEWARGAPQEVASGVLVNTSLRPFSPFYHRLRPQNYGALLRLVLWPRPAEAVELQVLAMTSNLAAARAPVLAHWAAVRRQRPVSGRNALRQLLAAARYRAPATAPLPHLLLLASRHDQLVASACSQALAAAWNLPLVMHPFAGHDLPLDDPAWVVAQVRKWATRPSHPSGSAPVTAA
jgi:pimeloyl-ACP methyl ester carboxylesterase